jgi:hypothetical protein
MIEHTTLLLVHLGGPLYGVDFSSTSAHLAKEDGQPLDSWHFADIKSSLTGLGWAIESDREEGAYRRLSLKRD